MIDAWVVWLTVTITWFLVMEIPALRNRQHDDTFSEHVWKWLKVKDPQSHASRSLASLRIIVRGGLVLFLLWLAGHLAMGWWIL